MGFPTESPTPGARIIIPDDDQSDASSCLFGGAVVYNDPGHPNIPGGDPPSPPPDDDDLDFPGHNLTPNDDSDDEPDVEHVPSDALTQLASAIQSLARSSHRRPPSDSTPRTKVREPDQFDGSDPRKLRVFLVQCELNFQDCPKAFSTDRAKVTFAQLYLKDMTLEWFEPDLLLVTAPAL